MSLRKCRLPNSETADIRRMAARDIAKAKRIFASWRNIRMVLQRGPVEDDMANPTMISEYAIQLRRGMNRLDVLLGAKMMIRSNLTRAR